MFGFKMQGYWGPFIENEPKAINIADFVAAILIAFELGNPIYISG